MTSATLVHPDAIFSIPSVQLMAHCSLFQNTPTLLISPYHVQSPVSLAIFREFVSALDGTPPSPSSPPSTELQQLFDEFGFAPSKSPLDSRIISDFPGIFCPFLRRRFSLLWRGGRDGFRSKHFHRQCDGHSNTLTLILDTRGNIFGGFTPVEWESPKRKLPFFTAGDPYFKSDANQKSFLFTLKNPHAIPARTFALQNSARAIFCDSKCGPHFADICVADNCNANAKSGTAVGDSYVNDTGLNSWAVFTGLHNFQVAEIEVFEMMIDSVILAAGIPEILAEFRARNFERLWRGSSDGFAPREFHRRCDGHANTLTVILDKNGNVFGGFTPVEWESRSAFPYAKADESWRSFLFTIRNPHGLPARRFALRADARDAAIVCDAERGPGFGYAAGSRDVAVAEDDGEGAGYTCLGKVYENNTGLAGDTVFTGLSRFHVEEIEVFEITD